MDYLTEQARLREEVVQASKVFINHQGCQLDRDVVMLFMAFGCIFPEACQARIKVMGLWPDKDSFPFEREKISGAFSQKKM